MGRRPDVVFMRGIEGALRLECIVCKATVDLPLPQTIDAIATTSDALVEAHRPCQERKMLEKGGGL